MQLQLYSCFNSKYYNKYITLDIFYILAHCAHFVCFYPEEYSTNA